MPRHTRKMKLSALLWPNGPHTASWRHPAAHAGANLDFAFMRRFAETAERGLFDFIFLNDGAAVRTRARDHEVLGRMGPVEQFEPITLFSALSAVTSRIGFVATASTTYNEPYNVARKFASLDHLSGGRSGWNAVTSWSEAEALNFNRERHLDHALRYRRANEFVDVVRGLWDSWEDDAFVRDVDAGQYFLPEKLHVLDHKGEFFSVKGPLNVARSPQGQPVLCQAGASEPGMDLGARTADVIFASQPSLEAARSYYNDLKGRLTRHGRSPEDQIVMPGIKAVIASSKAEAEDRIAELNELVRPDVGLSLLLGILGDVDLSGYSLDDPVPEAIVTNGLKSVQDAWMERVRRDNLTIRQLYTAAASTGAYIQFAGTPEDIADCMEDWFSGGAADGFMVSSYLPAGLGGFVDEVVPVLQRRGLFRTRYEGATLRENLGLPRPQNALSDQPMFINEHRHGANFLAG